MTILLVATVILLLLLALLVAGAWAFQEKIAFQPERPPYPDPGNVTRIDYTAADGQPLFAYVVGNPRNAPTTILVFHGNADLAVRQVEWARRIVEQTAFAVVIPEYRGYMGLPGRPTYLGSRDDARAALRATVDTLGARETALIYYGHSLGSAIAAELAVEHPPRALIMEAPFTSARDMAGLVAGRWFTSTVWRVVARLHFDTIRIVSSFDIPVSVAHGRRDRIIPFHMGERVFLSARNRQAWLAVPEASHSDIRVIGREAYWEWLFASLRIE